MTRALNKLNALKVRSCGPGKYSDGGGVDFHPELSRFFH